MSLLAQGPRLELIRMCIERAAQLNMKLKVDAATDIANRIVASGIVGRCAVVCVTVRIICDKIMIADRTRENRVAFMWRAISSSPKCVWRKYLSNRYHSLYLAIMDSRTMQHRHGTDSELLATSRWAPAISVCLYARFLMQITKTKVSSKMI
jgi:hypothetical protein